MTVHSHISKTTWPNFTTFSLQLARDHGLVPFGRVAILNVLPVLWMTSSCFHIIDRRRNVAAADLTALLRDIDLDNGVMRQD